MRQLHRALDESRPSVPHPVRPSAGLDNILLGRSDSSSKRPRPRSSSRSARRRNSLTMPIARLAHPSDLPSLLALFQLSEVSAAAQPRERAESIWQETLAHPGVHVFESDDHDRVAATCTLIIAPNLLRGGRRHGFLENVVTHPELRGRGHGSAVVLAALRHAWTADCHHVLMQSGRADPRVHAFYEGHGFRPGLRIAYVATRPTPTTE
jgi:GNAT superfamily N-acetyltransferase